MRRLAVFSILLFLAGCERVGRLHPGRYEVADREYSSQNYVMRREFRNEGSFTEQHLLNRCLKLEMSGKWEQKGGKLALAYARMRSPRDCRDSAAAWQGDSSELSIPLREVKPDSYESLLSASEGKPEKWIRWLRTD